MTKIIVISDSHGNIKGIEKMLPLIAENDYVIHLGDGAGDMRCVLREYPDKAYLCGGNCDFFTSYPTEYVLDIEGVRILCCHGHKYHVKSGLGTLAMEAKRRDCGVALYGHTHKPLITEMDGVTLINPGSLRLEVGKGGSYCYLVIHGKKVTPVLVGDSVY